VYAALHISRSLEEHERYLRSLLDRLWRYGTLIKPAKGIIRAPKITFLGYKASAEGSQLLGEQINGLQNYQTLKTISQLRRFLSILNYYRQFLPHAAAHQTPPYDVISGPTTSTPELHKAFQKVQGK
jgi:hypothetical protein